MDRNEQFVVLCKKRHINKLNKLINDNPTYPFSWNCGLHWACRGGHLNLVNLMISKGADKYNWGLYCACQEGHLDLVNLMISKGANDWNWGLSGACRNGHLDMANLMISKGANEWNWGLINACLGGHLDLANLMISKGADNWNWGFSTACEGGYLDLVRFMIDKGANNLEYNIWGAYNKKNWHIIHFITKFYGYEIRFNKSYIEYLFNLPKLDKSVCFLFENNLHLGILFKIINYI
jgi:hypothetical protein